MTQTTTQIVSEAGVVGAGGAGFPTHIKLAAKADSVLINAAECEPLLHKDKELLRAFADEVIAGLATAVEMVGAEQGIIGVKEKYTDVIELLESKLLPKLSVAPLRDAYPAGDEFTMVYDVLGRVIPPGGIPLNVGAVVMNVETVLNLTRSTDRPVTTKFLSVAGDVAEPVTLEVPVGISLAECLAAAGGATIDNPGYLIGGVMMGSLETDLSRPVTKTTGGLIVLPEDHMLIAQRKHDWKTTARIGRSACDQCSFCTELCPRYLLGHPIEPHRAMRSLGFNQVGQPNIQGTLFCCECNLCSFYSCPEGLNPKEVCSQNKANLIAEGQRWEDAPFNPRRPEMLQAGRKAPMGRLMQKLGLKRFRNVGPLLPEVVSTNRVGISLKPHIGAPCQVSVAVGDAVRMGQSIGQPPVKDGRAALGASVHASIDGTVVAIDDQFVWIEK
jgi:cobalamin reductase